jgi:hypothetical protein
MDQHHNDRRHSYFVVFGKAAVLYVEQTER